MRLFESPAELVGFYSHGMPFILERATDRLTTDFQTLEELFFKMSQVSLSFLKIIDNVAASDKKLSSQEKIRILKNLYPPC